MINRIREFFVDRKVVDDITKKYLAENIERAVALMARDFSSVAVVAPSDPAVVEKIINLEMAYKEAYMLNGTVAACVNFICDSVSSVPYVLKERTGEIVKDIQHEAVDRLNDPNDYQDRVLFMKVLVEHLLLCGNALIYKNKEYAGGEAVAKVIGGKIRALELFDPDDFDPITDGRRITKYVVKKHIQEHKEEVIRNKYPKAEFLANEIVHLIDNPDPKRPYWGMGRIQANYRNIDVDSQITTWWLQTMKNGCRKDVLLKFKKDLGENQFRRIKRQVEQQLAGFSHGRGFMILGREHDVEFLNQSPAEMDFSKSKEDTARNIMALFRVPAPLLNGQATYENQAEARQAYWLDNILMICNMITCCLSKFFLTEYKDLKNRNIWLTYDFSKVDALMRQYMTLTKTAVDLVGIGHSRDEVNRILDMGWNKGKGSDKNYVSANLISEEERAHKMKLSDEAVKIQRDQLEQDRNSPNNMKEVINKEKPKTQDARV